MANLTDGFVPRSAMTILGATARDASSLVKSGLWEMADGGWQFHDWLDYQPSREQVIAEREKEREKKRQQRAAGSVKAQHGPDGKFMSPGLSPGDTPGESLGESLGESPATRPDQLLMVEVSIPPPVGDARGPVDNHGGGDHPNEPNTRRALAALVADNQLPVDAEELLAHAYQLGRGDPWAGYLTLKPVCLQPLGDARKPSAVLRHRIGSIT
jgi:hypothetical protein